MKFNYPIDVVSGKGFDEALQGIEDIKQWIEKKSNELCERCASIGATVASVRFSNAIYTGQKIVNLHVETTKNGYVVIADGESVLFLEFGAGIASVSHHPEEKSVSPKMGPGTYPIPPGKGHWNDPHGWYLPREKGGEHTYGNPPSMAMYDARKEIEGRIAEIVREVFSK